jgi:hypothetical protein
VFIELTIKMKDGFTFDDVKDREFEFLRRLEAGEYRFMKDSCRLAYHLPGTALTRLFLEVESTSQLEELAELASAHEDMATFSILLASGTTLEEVAGRTFAHRPKREAWELQKGVGPVESSGSGQDPSSDVTREK